MRTAELGLVHRYEASGMMHGLVRVRQFTQDDAHIFCTPEQIESEIVGVINLVQEMYAAFGFEDYHVELSTKPEKHIGSDALYGRRWIINKWIIRSTRATGRFTGRRSTSTSATV
jgi:threonyl-tRNA synthetase